MTDMELWERMIKMKTEFASIDPNLKIGSDCGLMNVSGILELNNCLSYALTYTDFDFLYSFEHYFNYKNPKRPKKYISKDNDLVIVGGIDLVFHDDYKFYNEEIYKAYGLFYPEAVYRGNKRNTVNVEMKYLAKGIPLIVSCDHYYLHQSYVKEKPTMMHYHTSSHSLVVLDIDQNKQTCTVLDKFFGVLMEVPLERYLNAKMSETLNKNYIVLLNIKEMDLPESERIRRLLKDNLNQTLLDQITINGRTYIKNLKGLKNLIDEWPQFVKKMAELKGKYAPQFTTRVFRPFILQKLSFKNLMVYVSEEVTELKAVSEQFAEAVELWNRIDLLCDKCYIKNHNILDYIERFANVWRDIYEVESQIFETLSQIEQSL